jgi:hypothetical protein
MHSKTDIYIYNPSEKTGGTNNLMFNLALLLNTIGKYNVIYIDYKNSPLVSIIEYTNIKLSHLEIKEDEVITIPKGIVIGTLLDVKLIGKNILLSDETRMLFWSTHPDDGLKILSSFNIWLRLSCNFRTFISTLIHPLLKLRMKKFFELGVNQSGIIFMDKQNVESNKIFYDITGKTMIIPIFTNYAKKNNREKNQIFKSEIMKIIVLGRFTDFKVNAIYGLIEQIIEHNLINTLKIEVDFIGNGPLLIEMKKWIENKGLINSIFFGHINLSDIDELIIKYDILIGMGTSVLEGAKLKIPSMLIDGSYVRLPKEQVKFRWLYEAKDFEVGRFVTLNDKSNEGNSLSHIISELISSKEEIGDKCHKHWLENHSPASTLQNFTDILEKNSFTYKNNKHFLKEDFSSKVINYIKNKLK